MKRKIILLLVVMLLLIGVISAKKIWEKKPYTSWRVKDAQKILRNSPWTYHFSWGRIGNIGNNVKSNEAALDTERETVTDIYIHLFSSHAIRQAYAVLASSDKHKHVDKKRLTRFKNFVTRDFKDEIVLSWTFRGKPQVMLDLNNQLHSLSLAQLKDNTFLATNTGKKVYIKKYIPPTKDGTGPKFIFPRTLKDGTPLITPEDKSVRFQTKKFKILEDEVSIDATFKVKKMHLANGKLDF